MFATLLYYLLSQVIEVSIERIFSTQLIYIKKSFFYLCSQIFFVSIITVYTIVNIVIDESLDRKFAMPTVIITYIIESPTTAREKIVRTCTRF